MKVLLTCGAELTGTALRRALETHGHQAVLRSPASDSPEDIRGLFLAEQPDLVIHSLPYADADLAETQPEVCMARNAGGTLALARGAQEAGAAFLLLSDASVFGGQDERPWDPLDRPCPQSVRGLSVLQAEEAVRGTLSAYYIVRTGWLLDEHCKRLAELMRAARYQQAIQMPGDWYGNPTFAPDLAEYICALIRTDRYGIHHAANRGSCSMAELVQTAFSMVGLACRVTPVESSPCPASRRPLNARLTTEADSASGAMRSWQEALQYCLSGLLPLFR